MRIESVDLFYLAMPRIDDIGDGSQDMLLVRVTSDNGITGWGESEASPLTSIASAICPMSHSACHPVCETVQGEEMSDVADIRRIVAAVRSRSADLLQAAHTLSGIELALWDLLGKCCNQPVYELLGYHEALPKVAYASTLFGDNPDATRAKAAALRSHGFRAVKFGWGPYGRTTVDADADQVTAARAGLGEEADLLVDAGTVWVDDVEAALARVPSLKKERVLWLEEPFVSGAIDAYAELSVRCEGSLALAGGEGAHDPYLAKHLIDHGAIRFVQIDAGRVGGISEATRVRDHAHRRGVQYVNHTFTSNLALSASLQTFAGSAEDWICEYPVDTSSLAREVAGLAITPDDEGKIKAPSRPGLGIDIDLDAARKYVLDVEIRVGNRVLYKTPSLID